MLAEVAVCLRFRLGREAGLHCLGSFKPTVASSAGADRLLLTEQQVPFLLFWSMALNKRHRRSCRTLQFFLNHRCYLRSRVPERVGKSPVQLMTGKAHLHWLTLLGFGAIQPQRA